MTDYLIKSGLNTDLDALGFQLVGYGCTTCIGNSGPLPEPVSEAIHKGRLKVCAVLSGNRNFDGRIHPEVQANYLASPPLVVAYALAVFCIMYCAIWRSNPGEELPFVIQIIEFES